MKKTKQEEQTKLREAPQREARPKQPRVIAVLHGSANSIEVNLCKDTNGCTLERGNVGVAPSKEN